MAEVPKKKDEQEYDKNKQGKIANMIIHLVGIVKRCKERQMKRWNEYSLRKRDGDEVNDLNEPAMQTFCIAMDNYFTLPNVIKKLRELGFGIVGTARARRNWPPKNLQKVEQKQANFNDFFYCIDEFGTLCAKWMDNGLVFCVSTLHSIGSVIQRARRRPRKSQKNKAHVKTIWGDSGKANVYIPTLIDDYNHWMGGVDLKDQRITYYHPNLRCYRNWIPILTQILSIIRNNAFIIHRAHFKGKALSHKKFTLAMIKHLMMKAKESYLPFRTGGLRSSLQSSSSPSSKAKSPPGKRKSSILFAAGSQNKRPRFSKDASVSAGLAEYPQRKVTPRNMHVRVRNEKNIVGSCVVCAMKFAEMKKNDTEVTPKWDAEVKRTAMICGFCSTERETGQCIFLCKEHFGTFHDT